MVRQLSVSAKEYIAQYLADEPIEDYIDRFEDNFCIRSLVAYAHCVIEFARDDHIEEGSSADKELKKAQSILDEVMKALCPE